MNSPVRLAGRMFRAPFLKLTSAHYLLGVALASALVPQAFGANFTWTNNAGGNWNTAANWSPNQVPGPTDSATVSINAALTVSTPSAVGNVTFSGATLNGPATLTVGGIANWLGGDIN